MIDNGIDPGVDGKLHRRVCAWWMQGLVTGSIHGARCMIQATLRQAAEGYMLMTTRPKEVAEDNSAICRSWVKFFGRLSFSGKR